MARFLVGACFSTLNETTEGNCCRHQVGHRAGIFGVVRSGGRCWWNHFSRDLFQHIWTLRILTIFVVRIFPFYDFVGRLQIFNVWSCLTVTIRLPNLTGARHPARLGLAGSERCLDITCPVRDLRVERTAIIDTLVHQKVPLEKVFKSQKLFVNIPGSFQINKSHLTVLTVDQISSLYQMVYCKLAGCAFQFHIE